MIRSFLDNFTGSCFEKRLDRIFTSLNVFVCFDLSAIVINCDAMTTAMRAIMIVTNCDAV